MNLTLVAQLVTLFTPVITPAAVAGLKQLTDKTPRWALPLVAVAFGAGLQLLNEYLGQPSVGALWGGILGAAGVGVREILDQARKNLPASK